MKGDTMLLFMDQTNPFTIVLNLEELVQKESRALAWSQDKTKKNKLFCAEKKGYIKGLQMAIAMMKGEKT